MPEILRPRQRDHVVRTVVADDLVLFDADTNRAFTLNPQAAAVWALCDGTRTADDLAIALAERFEGPPDEIARDVAALVDRLRQQGLLDIDEVAA